jgi:hypothetical protein
MDRNGHPSQIACREHQPLLSLPNERNPNSESCREDGSDDTDSDSSSLNEGNFASFFTALASDDDDGDGGPNDAAAAQLPQQQNHQLLQDQQLPLSAEQKAIAWREMLAAQDPYVRDLQLPEFTHEVVDVAGIPVKVRHYSGADHRGKGTGRVVWCVRTFQRDFALWKESSATPRFSGSLVMPRHPCTAAVDATAHKACEGVFRRR